MLSEEENIAARRKENRLWAKIPEHQREKVQENYSVVPQGVQMAQGYRQILGTKKPVLREKGEEGQ